MTGRLIIGQGLPGMVLTACTALVSFQTVHVEPNQGARSANIDVAGLIAWGGAETVCYKARVKMNDCRAVRDTCYHVWFILVVCYTWLTYISCVAHNTVWQELGAWEEVLFRCMQKAAWLGVHQQCFRTGCHHSSVRCQVCAAFKHIGSLIRVV